MEVISKFSKQLQVTVECWTVGLLECWTVGVLEWHWCFVWCHQLIVDLNSTIDWLVKHLIDDSRWSISRIAHFLLCFMVDDLCVPFSPGLTPDLPEVGHAHRAAHASVEVPADLEVGMVGVEPEDTRRIRVCHLHLHLHHLDDLYSHFNCWGETVGGGRAELLVLVYYMIYLSRKVEKYCIYYRWSICSFPNMYICIVMYSGIYLGGSMNNNNQLLLVVVITILIMEVITVLLSLKM